MSSYYSREAFAARLGDEVLTLAEADGASGPPPGPDVIERLRRILAPAVTAIAERERLPDMADAA